MPPARRALSSQATPTRSHFHCFDEKAIALSSHFCYSGKSGITHLGGCIRFFLTASSAISSILSNEVSWMKLDAVDTYSRLGHLSPKTQPFTQASAQFTVTSTVISFLSFSLTIGRRIVQLHSQKSCRLPKFYRHK